jgi:putative phage-type endonuclease
MAPIIIDTFQQRSDEWLIARLGNPGASSISKIITSTGHLSKQREDYLMQLAAETVSGRPEDSGYLSRHMVNGIEREDSSRAFFEMIYGVEVRQVGIVFKDEFRMFHCSPDGLVGDNAILELKNPMQKTHVKSLLDGTLPTEYYGQCQMSLYVCERELCYFMSSCEGLPPFILEVRRDEDYICKIAKALDDFWVDLCRMVEKIKAKGGVAEVDDLPEYPEFDTEAEKIRRMTKQGG